MLKKITALMLCYAILGCAEQSTNENDSQKVMADMVLENANIYTFSWDEPSVEGVPAINAPVTNDTWTPEANAIAIKDGEIIALGSNEDVATYKDTNTEVINLNGAYVYPGFVDTHTHIEELGATLDDVDLKGG